MRRRASSSAIFLLSLRSLSSSSRMRPRSSSTYNHQEGALSSLLPADPGLKSGYCTSRPGAAFLHIPRTLPALTSALALRSAAMSCTLSRCSLGADLYMSSSNFISFWLSWAFLGEAQEEGWVSRAGGHWAGVGGRKEQGLT